MEKRLNNSVTVIIETPKGSGHKYDFDPASGYFKLNKVMPLGMIFPFDFGYIPGTIGGDGDPVDVLVISELQTFTGCAVDCRIIGGIKASQKERDGERMRNDRIIAVPEVSVQYAGVKELSDLPKGVTDQLESFFKNYNELAGKVFTPLKRLSLLQASSIIQSANNTAIKETLVQLFIPVKDQEGNSFPKKLFLDLDAELKKQFGDPTIYSRTRIDGIQEKEPDTIKDELLIYEILTGLTDEKYWKELKAQLEKQFKENILIQMSKIRKV